MTIKDEVLEPFFITMDHDQFHLKETKEIDPNHFKSNGEEGEREVHHGYFTSMEVLVRRLIHIKISRDESVVTLQQFWQAWVTYSKKFTSIIQSINDNVLDS